MTDSNAADNSNQPDNRRRNEALAALELWYASRLANGRARELPPGTAKPDPTRPISLEVPEDRARQNEALAEAKKARPQNWTTRKLREIGRTARGRPIRESVPILDVLTADGRETRRSPGARTPYGVSTDPVVGDAEEVRREHRRRVARQELLAVTRASMMRLILIEPVYHRALEMKAAGYSFRRMADRMGIDRGVVEKYFECGLTWLSGCLMHRPQWPHTIADPCEPIPMQPGDLGLAE